MDSNKLEFPEDFFKKPRREATEESLADISEPMQVSEEVLQGKKKLLLTTDPLTRLLSENQESESDWIDQERKNPNNISFWYPKIKNCGIAVPNTIIVPLSNDLYQASFQERPDDGDKLFQFVKNEVVSEMRKAGIALPFIKNGAFSNKFDFKDCVPFPNAYAIATAFMNINYMSLCFETGGATEIAVRERIPYDEEKIPTLYNGLPLRAEFRVFYDFDARKVLYSVNYWDWDYCFKHISKNKTDEIVYRKWYPHINDQYRWYREQAEKLVENAMSDVDMTGKWSVDIMFHEETGMFWLIDMAVAERSAYWEKERTDG